LTIIGEGTYTVDSAGVVTFNPVPTFTGQATPVVYQVNDSVARTYSSVIIPTVSSVPPTATPDTVILAIGGTKSFQTIFGNGGLVSRNLGGTELDLTSVCIVDPSTSICGATPVIINGEGTYTLDAISGIVTFVAGNDARPGQQTPIVYKISDLSGHVVQSTLTPTIVSAPTTNPDTSTGARGAVQVIPVITNDVPAAISAQLVPSSVRLCSATEVAPNCTQVTITVVGEGTYSVNSTNGDITFTPVEDFVGTATPVVYSVADIVGQRRASSITVIVDSSSSNTPASGGSSSSSGIKIIPTTGRNTSDLVGLLLVIIAIGVVVSRAARRTQIRI
jgi:CshA-type fibril repeat protein